MPRSAPSSARRPVCALGLLGLAGLMLTAEPRVADAAPPTSEDFQITYFLTDEQGNRVRQMTEQDMQSFVNQARCECSQNILARITLQQNSVDANPLEAYVGQMCAQAQVLGGIGPNQPCAQLTTGLPQVFQTGPEFSFDPVWLAHGVMDTQAIETAVPVGGCSDVANTGGVWMCSGANDCDQGNFFMMGDVNLNTQNADTPQGISFDYIPPVTPPTNFQAEGGDGAVRISWELSATADIAGYRVLCADMAGDPIDNGVSFTAPGVDATPIGNIYYTRDNLCPGGPFGEDYDPNGNGWGDDGGDTGDTTDTDTTDTTDTGTDTSCDPGNDGCACLDGDVCDDGLTCVDGTCMFEGCTPGELNCICTDGGTCDSGLTCQDNICQAVSGIETMSWDYVCSENLSFNTTSTKITGLDNNQTYQFLVVAYDRSGNAVAGEVILATPVPTNGLWEQCDEQTGVCGSGWNCSVTPGPRGFGWLLGLLGLGGLGAGLAVRRRRRRA